MEPKQRRFSIRYTIVTIVAMLVIEAILFAPHPETLAYSDFVRLLKAGKVSDLTLSKEASGARWPRTAWRRSCPRRSSRSSGRRARGRTAS